MNDQTCVYCGQTLGELKGPTACRWDPDNKRVLYYHWTCKTKNGEIFDGGTPPDNQHERSQPMATATKGSLKAVRTTDDMATDLETFISKMTDIGERRAALGQEAKGVYTEFTEKGFEHSELKTAWARHKSYKNKKKRKASEDLIGQYMLALDIADKDEPVEDIDEEEGDPSDDYAQAFDGVSPKDGEQGTIATDQDIKLEIMRQLDNNNKKANVCKSTSKVMAVPLDRVHLAWAELVKAGTIVKDGQGGWKVAEEAA